MRLIDADSLQSVKFHALPYTHITPIDADAESYERGWNDAIDAIMIDTPSSQPEQRWIPCSELLPDKEGRYLCTVGASFHNPRVMTYAPDTFLKGDCDTWRAEDGAYCFNWFVRAWMPLPDPYKKEISND